MACSAFAPHASIHHAGSHFGSFTVQRQCAVAPRWFSETRADQPVWGLMTVLLLRSFDSQLQHPATDRHSDASKLSMMSGNSCAESWDTRWQWVKLGGLSAEEQYAMHSLRQKVFVVEQDCVYLDADGADLDAWHLLGWMGEGNDRNGKEGGQVAEESDIVSEKLVAYLRAMADPSRKIVKLGRIATASSHRGVGLGRQLMEKTLDLLNHNFTDYVIRLDAQTYATGFYTKFGFELHGEEFLEDGIPHIGMVRKAPLSS